MADAGAFKLFRSVDPNTVNIPIREKFAKLTLSSNKKKQTEQREAAKEEEKQKQKQSKGSNVSRQLLSELNETDEHPLLRSDSSISSPMKLTPPLDVSDYMETLQLSGDVCTQQTLDVEGLSAQVSNLSMQAKHVSICISSTTEEEDEDFEASCITISDTCSSSDNAAAQQQSTDVSAAQQHELLEEPGIALGVDKLARIEEFLRDVSLLRRGLGLETLADHTRLASADTESMSLDMDATPSLPSYSASQTSTPQRPIDSSKLLADNETELNTLCSEEQLDPDTSKRLADNETEVNTPDRYHKLTETEVNTSDQKGQQELPETEVNTPDQEEQQFESSGHQSSLNPDESITIPETSSEAEQSPAKPSSSSSSSGCVSSIQVSSINISAKINIKIKIPTLETSSAESEDVAPDENNIESPPAAEHCELYREQEQNQLERSVLAGDQDASEDEQFLTQAEKLLNQLYGRSWQTPDIIRTLKRSSGSGGKTVEGAETEAGTARRTPLTELRRQPKARRQAVTTVKKRVPPPALPSMPNDSALDDFSIFKRALDLTNKMNSTHLPKRGARTEQKPKQRERIRTNHKDEERWRALIDSDSGTDASDDDDADATGSDSSDEDDGHVTYLDLTKAEVQVVSDPDGESEIQSPKFPKRLNDILRTCRATEKAKLPATPTQTPLMPTQSGNPTRRQLFTPNTGYENEKEAKQIVDQAIDVGSLEDLELIYLPGSSVHKRVQEVKKQLGIATESPKSKPIFKVPTPKTAPPKRVQQTPKTNSKKNTAQKCPISSDKCGFIKSLEPQISRDRCDNEAFFYRENFAKNKEQLAKRLYDLFNQQVFNNELDVPITWSKLLRNTAGRCKNKKRLQSRTSAVELSVKVLTSADRLRCTLIHELCHAAAWVFNGEGGHGRVWKNWAQRANNKFPDLPPIRVCHNYDIEFKYTYKCTKCNTSSHAHSRSRKVESLRCRTCRGPITLFLNKKDKTGNIVPTPVREATGFAKFVKDNFQKHKKDNLTAAQVMRILGAEYAKQKGNGQQLSNEELAAAQASIVGQVETLTLD